MGGSSRGVVEVRGEHGRMVFKRNAQQSNWMKRGKMSERAVRDHVYDHEVGKSGNSGAGGWPVVGG